MTYPDHVLRNREFWTTSSPSWVEPGRKAWASSEIVWGIWEVPEREVHALGDLTVWHGLESIELGCGTGYVSAWLARLGMKPVGIDITPKQLEAARGFQKEFGLEFPLIEGSAEAVPLPDGSFDLAITEYGASIWCDPFKWIPEAARLLRPGGVLVFLRNSTVSILTAPNVGPSGTELIRDQRNIHRVEFEQDGSVEFHLPAGDMIRLLKANGFEIEDLIDIYPPADAPPSRHDFITLDWAHRWPTEEIWRARKRSA